MTPFNDNITKSIDNLNKLQEDVENTITDLQEQIVDLEEQIEEMEDLETKEVTITTNTETTIEPTTGKYALEKVVVTTNVQPNLEEKTLTITENKETTITPSENYQGLSRVVVTTNVQSGNAIMDFTNLGTYDYQLNAGLVEILGDELIVSREYGLTEVAFFQNCKKLIRVPTIVLPSYIVKIQNLFNECVNLLTLPNIDTTNVTNFNQTFYNCKKIPLPLCFLT